jgi:pimeloyl-ACP methyl ester carboxylesterase
LTTPRAIARIFATVSKLERALPDREVIRARAADGAGLALTRVLPASGGPAVILIPGFGQNRTMWDLPGRSFSEYLARMGFDAYVLELRGHGLSRGRGGPYARRIADYADLDLPAAVEAIRARSGGDVLLVGHSMGGIACLAAPPALLAEVRGVVAVAAPTHFGRGAPALRLLLALAQPMVRAWRPGEALPRALPTELFGELFDRTVPLFDARVLPLPLRIWEPGQIERNLLRTFLVSSFDREASGAFFDLARWARTGSFDRVPGGECIRERMRRYPAPILFVAGQQDKLAPPSSIRPGYEITGAPRKSWRLFGHRQHRGRYGHIDLVIGRHAPAEVWPEIAGWMRDAVR